MISSAADGLRVFPCWGIKNSAAKSCLVYVHRGPCVPFLYSVPWAVKLLGCKVFILRDLLHGATGHFSKVVPTSPPTAMQWGFLLSTSSPTHSIVRLVNFCSLSWQWCLTCFNLHFPHSYFLCSHFVKYPLLIFLVLLFS